ncbi:MAG: SufS family cysteine desulfurase [Candidatus Latescibacteria bacterium]|nr:SufS family cysteine desulfurase [Candidatus Latescibacterota bacterium]
MTTAQAPSPQPPAAAAAFDIEKVRSDFPILRQLIRRKPLAYLDNAATTQKPQVVIDALSRYYSEENANIHRGVHFLSQQATFAYERARARVRLFLNAADNREIIFVRGTTEAINLVAQTYGRAQIAAGDEIVISHLEHHSNIVPWQQLCREKGAHLRVIPIDDSGALQMDEYEKLLNDRTRLVAVAHASNSLGTINPVAQICQLAHARDIPVLVDGAQGAPHMPVDVRALDCDFYAFSGHKLFGPTGIGVLYGRQAILEEMPPYESGGSMIQKVSFEETTYADLPTRFEAGTPHIAGAIALEKAIDYITALGPARIAAYEDELLAYATQQLMAIPGLRLIGTAPEKVAVLSFVLDQVHPHDIGTILDAEGVAVRAGHHCAQPVMAHFGIPASVRASLAFYNDRADIDALVAALHQVTEVFAA